MNNKKSTKRALLSSVLSLLICLTMLIGTTFAWFTDSVTSTGNKIVSGDLDIDLYMWNSADDSVEITNESDPIFGGENSIKAQNNAADTLWEPGKTQVVYLSIKNNGSLDLKYKVALEVKNPANGQNLYEVMEYAITPDAKYGEVTEWTSGSNVVAGMNATAANDVTLKTDEEHFFALSVHMEESAGNEYMDGSVEFDIKVLAGQLASESDSFDNTYDTLAHYAGTGYAATPEDGVSAVEILIRQENDSKIGSVVVPADAIASDAPVVIANITSTTYDGNIVVEDGYESQAFEVSVDGLKENNDVPVKVQLRIAAGLDPATVSLYHYDEWVNSTYNPETGYVTFETTGFSPFTVVYDAESKYVEPEENESKLPKAEVVQSTQYENVDLPWGSYGQWSPTAGLDSQLEAAYTFKCIEDAETAAKNPYANWRCDFYVKLDKDLGANQIFLGGNYGSFGWVGFHNGTMTLPANQEIPLLGSVTSNPWTYSDVASFVGEFICGVGDVNDALKGATFTVMLRLTNPDDASEYYNVATINYTFK